MQLALCGRMASGAGMLCLPLDILGLVASHLGERGPEMLMRVCR